MTEEDKADLREMQAELVGAQSSPWEPRCVARAFRTDDDPFVFTMHAWIDLDAVQSPFLIYRQPEAEEALWDFGAAFAAFGHRETTPEACEPDELLALGEKMIRKIREGFAMHVRLAPPVGEREVTGDNGLGNWLPILACLKAQLGFSLAEALALPVGQAYALIAAHRCNEGRTVAGETYALRDVQEEA